LVLSLAAFAEEALGALLKAFMTPSEATAQLIEGFNAPLGTFSSRIKAAYAIGLITKEQFLDLERLRKIRNEFAHSWKPTRVSRTFGRAYPFTVRRSDFKLQAPHILTVGRLLFIHHLLN
jgi:hypothetical protein